MSIRVIFDDTTPKSEVIEDVIGNKGFRDVVVKRKTLGRRFEESIKSILETTVSVDYLNSFYEIDTLINRLDLLAGKEERVIHFFSHFIISDEQEAGLTLQKLLYVDDVLVLKNNGNVAGALFKSTKDYIQYLRNVLGSEQRSTVSLLKGFEMSTEMDGVFNISGIENFIQCITGNFEARYFNTLKGDDYTIVKSSANKEKIKAEYSFYHLLPEDMQFWFVEPFNYSEDDNTASYAMERLHMTDLAIKWVHGSIGIDEFSTILNKYFYFFKSRHSKEISKAEYETASENLYEKKVLRRVEELKKHPQYDRIGKLLLVNNNLTIDDIVKRYLDAKEKIEKRVNLKYVSVIGHGDPCFANTMYNKSTKLLKFIDPKGAVTEEELWTDPYYDIAKLSHSICGRYDFFNNGLFEIVINNDFSTELVIDFDNSVYIEMFKDILEKNGYDYWLVRIYEASLFISMLPLHIDNPYKVYGFLINALNIIEEVERNV